jgi:hypothetical protein
MLRRTLRVDDLKPGEWSFDNNFTSIWIFAPNAQDWFDGLVHLPISIDGSDPKAWKWDGNKESPTLSPSILIHGKWHGWLRAGKLVDV